MSGRLAPGAAELAGFHRRVRTAAGRSRRQAVMRLRALDPRERRDPDFIVVGAQKAGTTSLLAYLTAHPDVDAPLVKEIQYFSLYADAGREWYRRHFPLARRLEGGRRSITGEASPLYMVHPLALDRIAQHLPEVKVVAILRDPVQRLVSQHGHSVRLGWESLPLAAALAAEPQRIGPDLETLRRDPHHRALDFRRYSYLTRSLYSTQVERICSLFPDRCLFLRLEDLTEAEALRPLCEFLGIEPDPSTPFEAHNVNAASAARSAREIATIDAATLRRLDEDARVTCDMLGWAPWPAYADAGTPTRPGGD